MRRRRLLTIASPPSPTQLLGTALRRAPNSGGIWRGAHAVTHPLSHPHPRWGPEKEGL